MLRIDVITLFPEVIEAGVGYSIVGRAQEWGLVRIRAIPLRDFAEGKHKKTDDEPYGGGAGLVMKPEPIFGAVEYCLQASSPSAPTEREAHSHPLWEKESWVRGKTRVILLEPQGVLYTQAMAQELSEQEHLILICGHYEGVDARVRTHLATDVISIGDYVLTGGELPALIVIDSVVRLLPGAIHSPESLGQDSYADGLLGYPQYTRPEEFRSMRVPSVLLSGNHGAIARWRRREQLRLTRALRPDLFAKACLTSEDINLLRESTE
ncbi:MAG: tRNA (guanosine(37)-N1)-methyltransferase TrmD [Fimbriimonadales bacterium]|nr:tRNA (guanosine(37)-N1)-methyltransferase TrmD [Fimbriimonadales bacterium]